MAVVVFHVVALIFQGVEGFILNFPPASAYGYQFFSIAFICRDIGNPTTFVNGFTTLYLCLFILEIVDVDILVLSI